MAVAFDAVGPSSAGTSGISVSFLQWTHTVVGSGVALVAAFSIAEAVDTDTITSAALDPAGANLPFTSLGTIVHSNNNTAGYVSLWGIANVSSGAHTVRGNFSASIDTAIGGSVSYTGAATTVGAAFSAQQSAFGASGNATVTFTGSTSGNVVFGAAVNGQSFTGVSSGVSRFQANINTFTAAGNLAGADIAGGGSVAVTFTTTSDWWGLAAVEVKVPSGPPPEGPHNSNAIDRMGLNLAY